MWIPQFRNKQNRQPSSGCRKSLYYVSPMRQQLSSCCPLYIPEYTLYDQVRIRSEYTDQPPILCIAVTSHPTGENVRPTSPAFRPAAARASAKLHTVIGSCRCTAACSASSDMTAYCISTSFERISFRRDSSELPELYHRSEAAKNQHYLTIEVSHHQQVRNRKITLASSVLNRHNRRFDVSLSQYCNQRWTSNQCFHPRLYSRRLLFYHLCLFQQFLYLPNKTFNFTILYLSHFVNYIILI